MSAKDKRMHVISTKLTMEQRAAIEAGLEDRTFSRFAFEAIKEKAQREGIDWPEHEWAGHGGKRPGAGRPPKS